VAPNVGPAAELNHPPSGFSQLDKSMFLTATLIALATSIAWLAGILIINVLEIVRNTAEVEQLLTTQGGGINDS
jgi:hypothetical protein